MPILCVLDQAQVIMQILNQLYYLPSTCYFFVVKGVLGSPG